MKQLTEFSSMISITFWYIDPSSLGEGHRRNGLQSNKEKKIFYALTKGTPKGSQSKRLIIIEPWICLYLTAQTSLSFYLNTSKHNKTP